MRFFDKSSSDCGRATIAPSSAAARFLLPLLALSQLTAASPNPPPPQLQYPILPPGLSGDSPQQLAPAAPGEQIFVSLWIDFGGDFVRLTDTVFV